ncbi:MAG: glycosyltransferase [Candidatus Erginobacter occultus]|nr:glycosyltransferase [Candidatus Erginobacter occultus]
MTSRPRRILYVIDKMVRAGAQRHLRELLPRFDRREIVPVLCCLLKKGPLAAELAGEGIGVESLELENIIGSRFLRAVAGLKEIIRRREIDLVHSYLFAANLVAPPAGFLTGTPVITSRRDTGFWKTGRHILAHRAVNPLTRKITANSREVVEYLRRRERVRAGKIALIYNGVEVPGGEENPARPAGEAGRIVIGALGNIRPVKGYRFLLEALRLLPPEIDWELRVAGRTLDPGCREELGELVRGERLAGRVSFSGETAQPGEFLRALDIYVLPSLAEGFSNSLIEAMVRGRPVIASAVGANPEVIVAGESGFLVPPGDRQRLAARIEELARNPRMRQRLGRAGEKRVREDFTLEAMCRRYRELYYECA